MQTGRNYPQILERWMSPDQPPTLHPPLKANFHVTREEFPITYDFGAIGVPAEINMAAGTVVYRWTKLTLDHFYRMTFTQNMLPPVGPGVAWEWLYEDELGNQDLWIRQATGGWNAWRGYTTGQSWDGTINILYQTSLEAPISPSLGPKAYYGN